MKYKRNSLEAFLAGVGLKLARRNNYENDSVLTVAKIDEPDGPFVDERPNFFQFHYTVDFLEYFPPVRFSAPQFLAGYRGVYERLYHREGTNVYVGKFVRPVWVLESLDRDVTRRVRLAAGSIRGKWRKIEEVFFRPDEEAFVRQFAAGQIPEGVFRDWLLDNDYLQEQR